MIMYITCNPYDKNPFPHIEYDLGLGGGKERISPHSSLGRVEDEPLEKNLSAYTGWDGLFFEVIKIWHLPIQQVIFCGSLETYCKIKSSYKEYALKNFPNGTTNTDRQLAENISPENRQKFLISRYKNWCNIYCECALDEMWQDCHDILTAQGDVAKKIIKVNDRMNKYIQESFTKEEESWRCELAILLNDRRLYEGNLTLSTSGIQNFIGVVIRFEKRPRQQVQGRGKKNRAAEIWRIYGTSDKWQTWCLARTGRRAPSHAKISYSSIAIFHRN